MNTETRNLLFIFGSCVAGMALVFIIPRDSNVLPPTAETWAQIAADRDATQQTHRCLGACIKCKAIWTSANPFGPWQIASLSIMTVSFFSGLFFVLRYFKNFKLIKNEWLYTFGSAMLYSLGRSFLCW